MAVVVARYLADGDLDQTFGARGKVRTDIDGAAVVYDVQINQQGKVTVLAGGRDLYRIRYAEDGDLEGITPMPFFPDAVDGSIGAATSYVPVPPVAQFARIPSLPGPIATSVGRVLAAGWVIRDREHWQVEMAVAAYLHSGQPDPGFNSDGRVSFGFFAIVSGDDIPIADARAVAVDNFERVVVSGYATNGDGSGQDFAVARLLKDGNPDPQFSQDGRRITKFPNSPLSGSSGVLTDGAGRIVSVGTASSPAQGSQTQFAMAKYTLTGELDSTFGGNDGLVTAVTPTGSPVTAHAVKGDMSQRFVVVGGETAGLDHVAIARFLPNGTRDQAFGGSGFGPFSPVPPPASAWDVHIDSLTGKITVVGESKGQFAVIRLRDNGSLAGFGDNGSVVTRMGTENESSIAMAVAMDPFSRIVVAGIAGGRLQRVMRRPPVSSEAIVTNDD